MTDPYQILGVARSATDDEVKNAYRKLCRKYHPDRNPGNEAAEDMFIIVQNAYDTVMDERKMPPESENAYFRGAERSGARFSESGGKGAQQGQAYDNPESAYLQAAANYISNHDYREAVNVLLQVHNHNAYWYYLSALANAGLGNNFVALEHAQVASALSPGNDYYRMLAYQLDNGGKNYRNMRAPYGSTLSNDDFCMRLCAFGCFYNACCDGDPCFCC